MLEIRARLEEIQVTSLSPARLLVFLNENERRGVGKTVTSPTLAGEIFGASGS